MGVEYFIEMFLFNVLTFSTLIIFIMTLREILDTLARDGNKTKTVLVRYLLRKSSRFTVKSSK